LGGSADQNVRATHEGGEPECEPEEYIVTQPFLRPSEKYFDKNSLFEAD
jgi:hypothetical protein